MSGPLGPFALALAVMAVTGIFGIAAYWLWHGIPDRPGAPGTHHLTRTVRQVDELTRPLELGDLVVSPHQEHIAQRRLQALHSDAATEAFDRHVDEALEVAALCLWCKPIRPAAAIVLGDVRCRCTRKCGHLLCLAPDDAERQLS